MDITQKVAVVLICIWLSSAAGHTNRRLFAGATMPGAREKNLDASHAFQSGRKPRIPLKGMLMSPLPGKYSAESSPVTLGPD